MRVMLTEAKAQGTLLNFRNRIQASTPTVAELVLAPVVESPLAVMGMARKAHNIAAPDRGMSALRLRS